MNGMQTTTQRKIKGKQPLNQEPKKLVIKGFKKPVQQQNAEQVWNILETSIDAIHHKRAVPYSLEELYRHVENLCYQKHQDLIYKRLSLKLNDHAFQLLVSLKETLNQDNVLGQLVQAYSRYCQQLLMIRNVFLYFDRTFLLSKQNLWDLGLDLFRNTVLGDPSLKQMHLTALLSEINQIRDGRQSEHVQSNTKMLLDLSIYFTSFESQFIESSKVYYQEQAKHLVSQFDDGKVHEYLDYCCSRLEQEMMRCDQMLDPSTKKPLNQILLQVLVQEHAQAIIDFGVDTLLEQNQIQDLAKIYSLLQQVNQLDLLKQQLSKFIQAKGIAIVQDQTQDQIMVKRLLDFKSGLDLVFTNAFENNEHFAHTLKESFETAINKRQNKPAELIAKHLDKLLKSKGMSEQEVDLEQNKCLDLFRYTQGKDIFEAFYGKDLAKRLLLQKSASVDAEKAMLVKLKTQCGAGFTNKLEGMFKDVEVSKDIMLSFRESARVQEKLGKFEVNVAVLTAGFWPTYPVTEMILPPQFIQCQQVFADFYLSKHNGRRLTWQNSLGHCSLRGVFPKGEREFVVSLYQTVVLLLFNANTRLTYQEIKQDTGIEEQELCRTLQSLACGKVRVLQKSPRGRDINPDDAFEFNNEFSHQLFRITINAIQAKETEQEQKQTNERVFEDRQYQVDAAIVRIMKTRKQCLHKTLVTELYQMLKFAIQPQDLKKRIESLIDRDYLERDPTNSQLYLYLA
ncbi:ubiquitin-protein ligase, Cullin 4 [Gorgonomyces haynaldii]|nr:ubiquitin-protein ligase, Cullin 4 [Gorgonomyces haynaldii]